MAEPISAAYMHWPHSTFTLSSLLGVLAPSCGRHSRLLKRSYALLVGCQFVPPSIQPHFLVCLTTHRFHHHSATPAHTLSFASRPPLSVHHFPVIIAQLSLSRIQTFHRAHTDTSIRHAAIFRTFTNNEL